MSSVVVVMFMVVVVMLIVVVVMFIVVVEKLTGDIMCFRGGSKCLSTAIRRLSYFLSMMVRDNKITSQKI